MAQEYEYVDTEEMLRKAIDKLQKNEKQIPKEDLEGKYAKPYNALVKEIENLALQLFIEKVCYFVVPKVIAEEARELVRREYTKNNINLMKELRENYNVDNYIAICYEICGRVEKLIFNLPTEAWDGNIRYLLNPWVKEYELVLKPV